MKMQNLHIYPYPQSISPKAGFTIIELLVVIGIITILSGIMLLNYQTGKEQFALQRSAFKLAQDIRRVQAMAMSAREFESNVPSGYGIRFALGVSNYILFADDNDNQDYDPGADRVMENIALEKGIEINDLSGPPLRITFTPPDPTVTIKPGAPGWISLCIIGADCLDPSKTKTITINQAGLIGIE